jgi:hypothetical protein
MFLPCSAVMCMNEPPMAVLRCFVVFLLRPIKKCWRRMRSDKARLGPESKIVLKHSHTLCHTHF